MEEVDTSNKIKTVGEDESQRRGSTPEVPNLAQSTDAKKKKKKEDKSMDNVLKSLNSLETSEDKLQTLCRKYAELLDDHKTISNTVKQNQRLLTQVNREKDQLQSEHSKAVLAKSKLEGLCRELQRHNKFVKDESIARAKDDDEKRKEVTNKFQTTINEIQQQINEHYDRNQHLREENIDLATKMKDLINKYEIREQHIENILKSKEIESQLFEAKMQQAALQITEQKELFLQEKQKFLHESMESQKRIFVLEEQEKHYKAQLEMYTERYSEFQSTLSKSNDVFNTFKTEMEKMSKKMKRLEKDASGWKNKWETSNKTLLLMMEEKALSERETNLLNTKIGRLESLCRALQEERRTLSSLNNLTGAVASKTDEEEPPKGETAAKSMLPPSSPATKSESLTESASGNNPNTVDSDSQITPGNISQHEVLEAGKQVGGTGGGNANGAVVQDGSAEDVEEEITKETESFNKLTLNDSNLSGAENL